MKARQYDTPIGRLFCQNVRAIRKARGLSVQRLADMLTKAGQPIPRAVLTNIDLGRRQTVTIDEAYALAQALDMKVDELATQPSCQTCLGSPPAGFKCKSCGRG